MKGRQYRKRYRKDIFEFDHRYACWANNHRGWSKAKKTAKRMAKKRERRELLKYVNEERFES